MKKPLLLLAMLWPMTAYAAAPVPAQPAAPPPQTADVPAQSLTLAEAQRIALANHPEIKASEFETRAAQEDVTISRSGYYPQVSGNAIRAFADENTRLGAMGGLNDPTVIDRGSAGISVSQLITDFGRTDAMVEASKSELEAQKERGNLTRAEILLNVTRAYYDALRAQSLLKVAQETVQSRQTFLDQVQQLRNVKMRSDLDFSIASQAVDDANLLLLKAQNGRDDAMAELSEALGYPDTRIFTLAATGKASAPSASLAEILNDAMHDNPELAALQSEYQAARQNADAASREFYPTLSAVGFAGATPVRTAGQHVDPTYAAGGIDLSIPIFTGGRLTADADKAEAEAQAAKMRVEVERNELIRDIHLAFDSMQTAYKNIAVTEQMFGNAAKSLDLIKTRYGIGANSIVDLNQAELAETQAAVAEADATYRYLIRRAMLDYAIGRFSVAALPK